MKQKTDYDKFHDLAAGLLKVPHSELKASLEAEKRAKKRKKARISSASRVAAGKG
jgi:hypothetical protein